VGQTQINNSSRQITRNVIELAKMNQIEYLELPLGFDGISIVTHKKNEFLSSLTLEELKLIWQENSPIKKWNEVKPEWPNTKIELFSPGKDSGTFDYFKETILGKGKLLRSDIITSEDDNLLVESIANTENSLGFFGFAYYHDNINRLKLIGLKSNSDAPSIEPSLETIKNGSYFPLSRPLYLYVNQKYVNQKLMKKFLVFYMNNALDIVKKVGYVPLDQKIYHEYKDKINNFKSGNTTIDTK
jgi:phosphate transport system substrate-binding protein